MCRFYIYRGTPDEDLHLALKKSAERDPYAPFMPQRHGDGWGYAAVLLNGSLAFYKTRLPIWEDAHIPPLGLAGLAHARAASRGEPKGVEYSHPFLAYTDDGRLLFVAHNGALDKGALARALGRDPNRYSDSWLLALFLAERWDNPEEALKAAEPYTRTALNVGILEAPGPRAYVYSYFKAEGEKSELYYRIFMASGEGWTAAFSSTLARHVRTRAEPAEVGRLYGL